MNEACPQTEWNKKPYAGILGVSIMQTMESHMKKCSSSDWKQGIHDKFMQIRELSESDFWE